MIVVVACLWAPVISGFEGVFNYIQEIWGFISPGIVAAFLVGLVLKKAPPIAAKGAMWLGVPLYAICRAPKWIMDGVYDWNTRYLTTLADGSTKVVPPEGFWGALYSFNSWSFLHHMGLIFVILAGFMVVMTKLRPLAATQGDAGLADRRDAASQAVPARRRRHRDDRGSLRRVLVERHCGASASQGAKSDEAVGPAN